MLAHTLEKRIFFEKNYTFMSWEKLASFQHINIICSDVGMLWKYILSVLFGFPGGVCDLWLRDVRRVHLLRTGVSAGEEQEEGEEADAGIRLD